MRAFSLDPDQVRPDDIAGLILCNDVVAATPDGRTRLSKGRILSGADAAALRAFGAEVHLIEMGPEDVHEDAASLRLARAVAGAGLEMHGPVESQMHLRAGVRGLVEVSVPVLEALNTVPDVSVYTVFDGQPVEAGTVVAATKVTPLCVPESALREAEEIAATGAPVVQVAPFLGKPVGVVVRERVQGRARDKFESAIHMKIGWFGSPVLEICYLPDDVESIARAIRSLLADGAGLILAAGVNSTDPLDLTIQALDHLDAHTERRGVPAHPGSTCWLAYVGDIPIFGLALCSMFSRTTVLDLLLPRFLSGRSVRAADIAHLGHGGVLSKDMSFRFPKYGGDESEQG